MTVSTTAASIWRKIRRRVRRPRHDETWSRSSFSVLLNVTPPTPVVFSADVLVNIFLFLPLDDVLTLRAVSSKFKRVVDDTPQIQYRLQQLISQMQPTDSANQLRLQERVRQLDILRSTRSLRHRLHAVHLKTDLPLGQRYGDVFCRAYSTRNFKNPRLRNAVRCILVTGPKEEPVIERWRLEFDIGFHTLYIDSAQDLLVLLSPSADSPIRLLALSNGMPSPHCTGAAAGGVLHVDGYSTCHLRGKYFGLIKLREEKYWSGPPSARPSVVDITIIDWKQGQAKAHLSRLCVEDRLVSLETFVLLPNSSFMIAVQDHERMAIEIYGFALPGIDESIDQDATHIVTYEFPSWRPGARAGAAFFRTTLQSGTQGQPFVASQDAEMVIMDRIFVYHEQEGRTQNIWFAVNPRPFIDAVQAFRAGSRFGPRHVEIVWEAWGPQYTRCFAYDMSLGPYPIPVHGTRFLVHHDPAVIDFIDDFNPYELRAALGAGWPEDGAFGGPNPIPTVVTAPSTLPAGGIFHQDVVTYLPYRQIPVKWPTFFNPSSAFPPMSTLPTVFPGEIWVASQRSQQGSGNEVYNFVISL